MLETALKGSRTYWIWVIFLLGVIGAGFISYLYQFSVGLGITGMSRDVSWGLYIGQFTYLVGVAASAVTIVLPYYLHNFKKYGRIAILGEFVAVASVIMCMLFIFVDLGQPLRVLNVLLHPTPNSVMFFDMVVLAGYLMLNILCGWYVLGAERKGVPPSAWIKPFIILAICWAPSIHIVTAFLYQGLPGRHYWLTAIMAAKFLSSAFAAGPSLLIVISLILRKFTKFDPGWEAIQTMAKTATYFLIVTVAFYGFEVFTAFYSQIPGHMHPIKYLFVGIDGHTKLVPVMWTCVALAALALILFINPKTRKKESTLAVAAVATFISLWLEKGISLVVGGFVPNPFERVFEYWPTIPEVLITLGVWGIGFFVLTILYKVAISVKEEAVFDKYGEKQIITDKI
ncbi:MAG: polysulfide reductase NrfD [Nitrospirae bacterium]|jgi:Ni/Fe-hydrogenase subunit HybB-like protein|nr:polysulfide reductase NrfD [Nitrospirota bacterium]